MKQACNAVMPMACTVGELLAKNIEKTARRQLEGQHLLFGEYYFAELKDPLFPKLAD